MEEHDKLRDVLRAEAAIQKVLDRLERRLRKLRGGIDQLRTVRARLILEGRLDSDTSRLQGAPAETPAPCS